MPFCLLSVQQLLFLLSIIIIVSLLSQVIKSPIEQMALCSYRTHRGTWWYLFVCFGQRTVFVVCHIHKHSNNLIMTPSRDPFHSQSTTHLLSFLDDGQWRWPGTPSNIKNSNRCNNMHSEPHGCSSWCQSIGSRLMDLRFSPTLVLRSEYKEDARYRTILTSSWYIFYYVQNRWWDHRFFQSEMMWTPQTEFSR